MGMAHIISKMEAAILAMSDQENYMDMVKLSMPMVISMKEA